MLPASTARDGALQRVPLSADKQAARQMLARLKRDAERMPRRRPVYLDRRVGKEAVACTTGDPHFDTFWQNAVKC